MAKHIVKVKRRPIVKPCERCGKAFDSKYQAKRHICSANSIMGLALTKAGAV